MFIFKVQLLRKCFSFLFLRILGIFRGGLQKKTDFMNLSQNYLQNDVILSAAKNLKTFRDSLLRSE